jgi:hypothetical protein
MPNASAVRVDQIVFGWSEHTLTGHRGLGPLFTSLGSDEETAWWERRLVAHQWAAVEVGEQAGPAGLVYIQTGDRAAIVHKDTVTDAHGRGGAPLAHALVGPAAFLDARTALGLSDWPEWIGPQTSSRDLGSLTAQELRQAADVGYDRLSGRARLADALMLEQLVAEVLADPGGRFCVYPPQGTVAPAAELLCGLMEIIGDVDGQTWTFATAEAREPGTDQSPRVVFLTAPPGFSLQGALGHRVRLGQPAPPARAGDREPGAEDHAAPLQVFGVALAQAYAECGREVIDDVRPVRPIGTADAALAWAAAAQFAPGLLASPRYLLQAAEEGRLEPEAVTAPRPDDAGGLGGRLARSLAEMPAELLAAHLPAWRKGSAAAGRYPGVADAIRAEAVWRLLIGDPAIAQPAVAALGITSKLCGEQLMRCRAERGQQGLAAAFGRALALILSRGAEEITGTLAGLPPAELLGLADEAAAAEPTVAALLLQAFLGRPVSGEDRRACAATLTERGYLAATARHCQPGNPAAQSDLLAALLTAVFQDDLDVPDVSEGVIAHSVQARDFPLLHALGASAQDPRLRMYVLREAGQLAFEEQGLGPFESRGPAPAGPASQDRVPDVFKGLARLIGWGRTP